MTDSIKFWQLWLHGAEELVKAFDLPPSQAERGQHASQRQALSRTSFFGATEAEARQVLMTGKWPHGAQLVQDLAQEIEDELPLPKSRRRVKKWSDDGDEISVERLQAGQDCWTSSHRKLKAATGLVEIVCSWGSDCGASQHALQWSGASAVALCTMLEKADYSTELCLVGCMHGIESDSSGKGYEYVSRVRVDLKDMGTLLDVEQVASVAVYPPAWRIFGLAAFQQGPYSSGTSFNSHPHDTTFRHEPNGLYAYRPNVFTLELQEAYDKESAKNSVKTAIAQIDSLVNPEELTDYTFVE